MRGKVVCQEGSLRAACRGEPGCRCGLAVALHGGTIPFSGSFSSDVIKGRRNEKMKITCMLIKKTVRTFVMVLIRLFCC